MRDELGLETLLDLNGSIIDQGNGYWIKIEAWRAEAGDDTPHGIRYSLTLHEDFFKDVDRVLREVRKS
jgi:hypothetical protein